MKTSELRDTKFLTKEDAGDGILVTITGVERQDVGREDAPEHKWCVTFAEAKPLILNATNVQLFEAACGDDTDDWVGQKVVLFCDDNVSYQGKLVGGVRLDLKRTKAYRAKGKPAPAAAPADDIPF